MNSDDIFNLPDSNENADATHKRYMDGVKKALLIGIGNVPTTEDKFSQALAEAAHNQEFWHDPEIYDVLHYVVYGMNFDATRVKSQREKTPSQEDYNIAYTALPLIEEEMTRYYGASIQEIMGNYYLGTPLSPVNSESEESKDIDSEA